jgi:hypothetical protein
LNARPQKETAALDKMRDARLPKCEDDMRQRRQVLLELHTFLDSIFQHMSEALEVRALAITHLSVYSA